MHAARQSKKKKSRKIKKLQSELQAFRDSLPEDGIAAYFRQQAEEFRSWEVQQREWRLAELVIRQTGAVDAFVTKLMNAPTFVDRERIRHHIAWSQGGTDVFVHTAAIAQCLVMCIGSTFGDFNGASMGCKFAKFVLTGVTLEPPIKGRHHDFLTLYFRRPDNTTGTYHVESSMYTTDSTLWNHMRFKGAISLMLGLHPRVGAQSSVQRFLQHSLCERFLVQRVFQFADCIWFEDRDE